MSPCSITCIVDHAAVECGHNTITVPNVTYTCPYDNFTNTCAVSCAPGYRNASAVFTCGADANWHGVISCPRKYS